MSTDNTVMCAGSSYSSVHCLFKWRDGGFDSDMTWQGLGSEGESPEQCSCSAIGDTSNPEPLRNIALNNMHKGTLYNRLSLDSQLIDIMPGRLDAFFVYRVETFVYLGDDKGLALPSSEV